MNLVDFQPVSDRALLVVVTSGPSATWPQKAYRNPVTDLVAFLDKKHADQWAIFEFRAEGTGYPDEAVYNRIHHFPWPDHHPPPFSIVPNLMAAMRNWLQDESSRVAVVHCKAGKGRSGTVTCSYLISQQGWTRKEALTRFTKRRMRAGFGEGVSIPSQLRWVTYVDRWTNQMNKKYVERPVEVVELHIAGLRTGVKVSVEGFIDQGRRIKNFHTFTRDEKYNTDPEAKDHTAHELVSEQNTETLVTPDETTAVSKNGGTKEMCQNVILKPSRPVRLETSDINLDFERRNKSTYTGLTMVTSIAHVWINAWFEGGFDGHRSGVFEIAWAAMDGIKGSERKGMKAFDNLKVVWSYSDADAARPVDEPKRGEPVPEGHPTDWRGHHDPEKEVEGKPTEGVGAGRGAGGTALVLGEMSYEAAGKLIGKDLGLRKSHPDSANISRASSVDAHEQNVTHHAPPLETTSRPKESGANNNTASVDDDDCSDNGLAGCQSHGQEENTAGDDIRPEHQTREADRVDTAIGGHLESGMSTVASLMSKLRTNKKENSDEK